MDERIRELERAFQGSGDVADEVRLLRARLRLDLTSVPRLEVAALLGSESARALLAECERRRWTLREVSDELGSGFREKTLRSWFRKGCPRVKQDRRVYVHISDVVAWRWGQGDELQPDSLGKAVHLYDEEAVYRMGFAAVTWAVATHRPADLVLDPSPGECLRPVARWLLSSGEAEREAARAECAAARERMRARTVPAATRSRGPGLNLVLALEYLLWAVADSADEEDEEIVWEMAWWALREAVSMALLLGRGSRQVQDAVGQAVVPWALGYTDPLAGTA